MTRFFVDQSIFFVTLNFFGFGRVTLVSSHILLLHLSRRHAPFCPSRNSRLKSSSIYALPPLPRAKWETKKMLVLASVTIYVDVKTARWRLLLLGVELGPEITWLSACSVRVRAFACVWIHAYKYTLRTFCVRGIKGVATTPWKKQVHVGCLHDREDIVKPDFTRK